jgi:hypothetical protein
MIDRDDLWLRSFILQYLEQVEYWCVRFESDHNIQHFESAERFADAVRDYLPIAFKELNFVGLRNLYWSLSANQRSRKQGES